MRKKFYKQSIKILFFIFAFTPLIGFSQSAGAYRSALNGDWNMPSTWERFNGIVWSAAIAPPSSGDGIITITHVVTINSPTSADQVIIYNRLSVNSVLRIDDGPGIDLYVHGTLDLSGMLNGDGSVNVDGLMNWTDNFLSVDLTIETSSTLTVSNNSSKTFNDNKTLLNLGTIQWTEGNIHFNGGTLINAHRILAFSNNSLIKIAGTNLFNNTATGVFTKSAGTGITSFGIPVTNAGTIIANSGTLESANNFTNDGNVNMTSDATLTTSGGSTFTNNSAASLSTLTISDGSTFNNIGDVTMTSAASFSSLTTTDGSTFNNAGDITMSSAVSFSSITIADGSTFNNTGNVVMSSPTLSTVANSGGGIFTNMGDVTMSSPTLSTITNSGSTFTNSGDVTMSSPTLSTVTNDAGGTLTQNSEITFTGPATFNNNSNWHLNTIQSLGPGVELNNAGSLDGTGTIIVTGSMLWTGGTISVNITIAPGATLTVNTGFLCFIRSCTVLNQGTIIWVGGALQLYNAIIQNEGFFNQGRDVIFDNDPGGGGDGNLFNNTATGTITKSAGTETFAIHFPLTNAGTININSGTIKFANTTNHTGVINVATGATLENGNNFTDNGTINVSSASFANFSGTFTQNTLISFTGTSTSTNTSTWNVNVAQVMSSTATLNNAGTLGGSGSLLINGAMNWTNGTVRVNTTIASGATLTTSTGNGKALRFCTLLNQGLIDWIWGELQIDNAMIQNEGVFNQRADIRFEGEGGINLFNNTSTGTITKSAGAGTFIIQTPMTNAGTMNINSGTINFASATSHTGIINAASGTTLQNTNNFIDNGTINISSASFDNGGTFEQNNLVSFTGTATAYNFSTWNVNVAQSLSSTATMNNSGTLGGSGSLLINGAMSWTNGTVRVNITIAPGATLTTSTGNGKALRFCTLLNQGLIDWIWGELQIDNAMIQNEGVFNQRADIRFEGEGGINLFNNTSTGTITKSAGAGTFIIQTPMTNAGTININSGTIDFASTTIHTGIINVASGATLQNENNFTDNGTISISSASFDNGGVFTQNNLVSFTGTATAYNFNTWNVNVAQVMSSTATLNNSGTLGGSGSLLINGAMNWTNGTVRVNLTTAPGATLTSTGNSKFLRFCTLLNQGVINWAGGDLQIDNSMLQNEGVFNQSADIRFEGEGGTNLFNNTATGTITKSAGAGTFIMQTPVMNAGIVKGIGTIDFASTFTNNGIIAPGLSPGILTINGTAPFGASSTLSIELQDGTGAGTGHDQLQRDGDLTLAGILTVTETGTVPDGSYTIISLSSGTISGSFSITNLPAGYSIAVNPTTVVLTKSTLQTFYRDFDNDGYGNAAVSVQAASAPPGYVANDDDCNDANVAVHPTATELCNGMDDDCDGFIDEGVQTTFYRDQDSDGYGNAAITTQACAAPTGYVSNNTDCNDNNVAIHPGATESCNGVDDDCDGLIDEGVKTTFYRDQDSDGYGNAAVTTQACAAPAGYVSNNTDCNDNNVAIHPGATESCNGVDDDCDGLIDEGVKTTFYRDQDSDGYGNAAVTTQACSAPAGYVVNNTDCNDNNAAINPTATEVCNGIDDDCDGLIDEGVKTTFYRDQDGDGYGNAAVTTQACSAPAGYVANNTDCNDNNAAIHPGATESCNGLDDDCDGLIDEGVKTTFYRDQDVDGYGNVAVTTQACSAPTGYVANNTDCNDNNAAIHPGATESCNGLDDDCDGTIDEGCPTSVTISIADRTVLETVGSAMVPVSLSRSYASTVTVKYKTANGTAQQNKDYLDASGTITFLPGQTSKTIFISIISDAKAERDENFFVILSKPTNATISDESATITITETAPPSRISSNPVTELQHEEGIKLIVPNPQRKQEQLKFFGPLPGSFDVSLTDVNGKIVANLKNYRNNWSPVRLVPGIYFYMIHYKNQKAELIRKTGKLLIIE